jgi:hypothetical protein
MKSSMGFVKSVLSMKKPTNPLKIGSDMKLTIYSMSCMLAHGLGPIFLLTACKHVKTILKSYRMHTCGPRNSRPNGKEMPCTQILAIHTLISQLLRARANFRILDSQ